MLSPRVVGSIAFAAALCGIALGVAAQDAARDSVRHAESANAGPAEGRQVFESRCAGCHGLDGRGGERAPDIATRTSVQERSDAALSRIIHDGVPTAGMPAFGALDADAIRSLVRYLRMLQGKADGPAVAGNFENGSAIFFGKGRCSECHTIEGKGGFLGSDLSGFGASRSTEEIRNAIIKPNREGRLGGSVVVTTRDGSKHSGLVRNEDNFSLQLQTRDGGFLLLAKDELADIARSSESLMPSDYGSTLAPRELNDLMAFLVHTAAHAKTPSTRKKHEEAENEE